MIAHSPDTLDSLLSDFRRCQLCKGKIPEPKPVIRASSSARILVIGQAPGTRVHATGIPWNDPSGERLRQWMGVDRQVFYDESRVAIMPMGLCYPGKGKSGDLPPRPECAPRWHQLVLDQLPAIQCTLLIGQYAQRYYLEPPLPSVSATVANWEAYAPAHYVMPHPSPRNQLWLRKNPHFEKNTVPHLQRTLGKLLSEQPVA